MEELTFNAIDVLTGHAAARFKWLDVRSEDAWRKRPPPADTTHIPLQDLPKRASEEFQRDADLVVYGANDAETAEAEGILVKLGFTSVWAFRGGFETLAPTLFKGY